MTIAAQIKNFHGQNIIEMLQEAEDKAVETTQDWDNESTEYDFVDGSVLTVCGQSVYVYASR